MSSEIETVSVSAAVASSGTPASAPIAPMMAAEVTINRILRGFIISPFRASLSAA
jgi:hypothetical protein